MSLIQPTQPFTALRHGQPRTCHQLGICLNPSHTCTGMCEQKQHTTMQQLAPGVIDGPYKPAPYNLVQKARQHRAGRLIDAAIVCLAIYGLAALGATLVNLLLQP